MTALIIVAVLAYPAFHIGAGHTHHRYAKSHGLRPNFYWSSVRGPYASVRLPGEQRHPDADQRSAAPADQDTGRLHPHLRPRCST
jgi:hypothetical protein